MLFSVCGLLPAQRAPRCGIQNQVILAVVQLLKEELHMLMACYRSMSI